MTTITVSKETLSELTQRERLLSYLLMKKLTHDDTILELCKLCDDKYRSTILKIREVKK